MDEPPQGDGECIVPSGIYQIINVTNNKRYIGSAISLDTRKSQHSYLLKNNKHHSRHLQNAYNKYGRHSFIFETLISCSPELCVWYEQQFLSAWNPEYNINPCASNSLGAKRTKECRQKMSDAKVGKPRSEETKRKISSTMMGIPKSKEVRIKLRDSQKGRMNVGPHIRWHTNRGLVSKNCEFCRDIQ